MEIDESEDDWPVEKLHQIKSEHELWVTETLSETIDHVKLAKQTAVASIIDAAVSHCRLEEWQNWSSFALAPNPRWPKELPDEIFEFRQKVIAAIWPEEFAELKSATISFSILLHRSAQLFLEHSETKGDMIYPFKFYKAYGWNDNYDKDLEEYISWVKQCHELVRGATKAANWFADTVRKEVNPMFFAEKGKFLTMEGPFMDITYGTILLEYSEDEKNELPASLEKIV